MRLDAVDDRAAERAGDAHADLEAAGVGRLVAEQDQVERAVGRLRSAAITSAIARAVACGSQSSPSASDAMADEHGLGDADRDGVAQLLVGLGRADREHRDVAAVLLDEADRLLDRALLVRAGRERRGSSCRSRG